MVGQRRIRSGRGGRALGLNTVGQHYIIGGLYTAFTL